MRTKEIIKLRKLAIKEAQLEIDKIFAKYSKLIIENIETQLPKNQKLVSYNGICRVEDVDGKELQYGNAWAKVNNRLDCIAELQYNIDDDLVAEFSIPCEIIGRS